MVYLAEHPALAALEVRVHLDLPFELLPNDFVFLRVLVPDGLIAEGRRIRASETVATGDAWLTGRSVALRVPSVLLPYSWNVLLNPSHADAPAHGSASTRSPSTRVCGTVGRRRLILRRGAPDRPDAATDAP